MEYKTSIAQSSSASELKAVDEQKPLMEMTTQDPLLREMFGLTDDPIESLVDVSLSAVTLEVQGKVHEIRDAVGIHRNRKSLSLHFYPIINGGCCSKERREHVHIQLYHINEDTLDQWYNIALHLICGTPLNMPLPKRKKALVVINPASGAGNAQTIWIESCEHVFKQAHLSTQLLVTQFVGHATSFISSANLAEFEQIVCVGGDGIISEVVNGLMKRKDWKEACGIPISAIPAGSGNGVAKSLSSSSSSPADPVTAAFTAVKGKPHPVDIYTVNQEGHDTKFGFLSLGWGLISDVDFESEKWRCCGGARFTWTGIIRACCLRQYRARIQFLPAKEVPTKQRPGKKRGKLDPPDYVPCRQGARCKECSHPVTRENVLNDLERLMDEHHASKDATKDGKKSLKPKRPEVKKPSVKVIEYDSQGNVIHATNAAHTDSTHPEAKHAHNDANADAYSHDEWEELVDDFVFVWALNLAYPTTDMCAAPLAHLSDGYLDLVCTRGVGTCSVLDLLIGAETGDHINNTDVEYRKVRGLRIYPDPNTRESVFSMDGERLPYQPMEMHVFPGVLRMITLN